MDEPCSALDPVATAKIEKLIDELREKLTIVIVTHNLQQAANAFRKKRHSFIWGKLLRRDTLQISSPIPKYVCIYYSHRTLWLVLSRYTLKRKYR